VTVELSQPLKGKTTFKGQLKERDENHLSLTQKGRVITIPREAIRSVTLDSDD
jgi:ribosome maturation factor RimP